MPASKPNETGSQSPKDVPHGRWDSFPWIPFPEYGGSKSIIFRSEDGKIAAGAAKESGNATLTYPCDEFFYVTDGSVDMSLHGGESFTLVKGDFVYVRKGQTIDFKFSDDFANVAIFIDNEKITLV
ncbi:hypothetical protein BKA66DRAFT_562625 [Pyrenochaeta sp. MPI-SDFR-AT-0127]|nr:hypothetical protein BKA66DRAFT_562625 [Pyrenochaeta sp. MPI-SDFR-AT-0127]